MIYYRLELNGTYSFGEGHVLPEGAEELSLEDYTEAVEAVRNAVVETSSVTVLYPVDLWSRMTEDEADQVEAAIAEQSVRIQNMFRSASSYRSDHELWETLESTAVTLFGEERAAELLAASS